MIIRGLLSTVVGILFFQCSNPTPTTQRIYDPVSDMYPRDLEKVGEFGIDIDSLTRTRHLNQVYSKNDSVFYYVHFNDIKYSLEFFEVNLHDLIPHKFEIKLSSEGPDAIPDLAEFYVYNLDSIFVIDFERQNEISLINRVGNRIDTYSLQLNNYLLADQQGFYRFEYDRNKRTLNFRVMPYEYEWTKNYYTEPYAIEYSIVDRKIVDHVGIFPDNYLGEDCYYLYAEPSRATSGLHDVIFFKGSHELHLYDRTTMDLLKIVIQNAKSFPENIPAIITFGEDAPGVAEQRKYRIENAAYFNLYYDPFRKLYIQVCKKPLEYRNSDGELSTFNEFKYEIRLLDNDLGLVGNYDLPAKTYSPLNQIFSTPDGIFIGLNNSSNPNFDEDKIQFAIFKTKVL